VSLVARLRGLLRRHAIQSELDEELEFHIAHEVEANVARGLTPEAARRLALRDLGGVLQTAERVRDVRTLGVTALWNDVRYGMRALAASPRYAIVSLLTVLLMVGGVTTVFTFVRGVVLRPLPYPHADRLVVLETSQPGHFGTGLPPEDLDPLQAHVRSVEAWGGCRPGYVDTLPDPQGQPLQVQTMRVTPGLFSLLELEVLEGRPLVEADWAPGAPPVIVIRDDLRRILYGDAPDVVGRALTLDHHSVTYTIVGVSSEASDVPTNWVTYPMIWMPLDMVRESGMNITVFGRVRDGVGLEEASEEIASVSTALAARRPDTHAGRVTRARPLLDRVVGDYKRLLWVFFGAVSCVLLIGVANLVSLQLARNGTREREITVRLALGSGRLRVMRQLVVESLLVGITGSVLGLGCAAAAVRWAGDALPRGFPRADAVAVDGVVAWFVVGLALVVGVGGALVPAWQASRGDLATRMNEGGRGATMSRRRARVQRLLLGTQTACALLLLVGAGLLLQNFTRLLIRDVGIREEHLWVLDATLPQRYDDDERRRLMWEDALLQIRALSGMDAAALVSYGAPLTGSDNLQGGIVRADAPMPTADREGVSFSIRRVSGDYFRALGIRLLEGRAIADTDDEGTDHVVVVNERAAARLWPGERAVGQRLRVGTEEKTVVGLLPDYLHTRLDARVSPQMYESYLQPAEKLDGASFLLRTRDNASGLVDAAKAVLLAMEPAMTLQVSTVGERRWTLLAAQRFRTVVVGAFAAAAFALALVGLVGVVGYGVAQRRKELALRVVLGAQPRHVAGVTLQHAIVPVAIGVAVGLVGALVLSGMLESLLVDMSPLDLPTYAGAVVVLACGATMAALLPVRRALAIRPADALRDE
jgi:putative ABC transport system permease protein